MAPRGTWLHLCLSSIGALLCAAAAGAWAQDAQPLAVAIATVEPRTEPEVGAPQAAAAPADPASVAAEIVAPASPEPQAAVESAAPVADVPSPAPDEAPAVAIEPAAAPAAPVTEPAPLPGIGNDEVREMAAAQFSDSTIIAVIAANDARFDVSPRGLVALKNAGVSERVIEAMLAAEAAKTRAPEPEAEIAREDPAAAAAAAAAAQAAQEYAKLSEMVERLAAQQQAAAAAQQEAAAAAKRAAEVAPRTDSVPRAWIIGPADRTAVAPTIAQVGFAGGGKRGSERLRTLQGLAGQAVAFVNPAVGGIATTLGSLFRPDEERTAVWALAATESARVLDAGTVFEIDYAYIPGVDPDRYHPTIVQLVPTNDNYRLVAAAETEGTSAGSLPNGPIIEELVPTNLTRLGRGQYRVAPRSALHPGEYALVLRPIPETPRQRRRNKEASLGELLGGGTTQILYLTWDFSVEPPAGR